MKTGVIRIKNAVFYAYHGVFESEQNSGGKFELDIELHCDFSEATREDSLSKTVDYEAVYSFVKKLITEKRYYLIESLASKIANGIIERFKKVNTVIVRLRKPSPPVGGVVDCVEVEIEVDRNSK